MACKERVAVKHAFLVGDNIYLRGLCLEDLEGEYVAWFNDAEVCQYNSHHVFPYNKQMAESYIKNVATTRTALILAIVLKSTDKHIGNISLQNIDPISRSAEFAIIVGDKNEWGKGYSKEAAFLIAKHGFASLNLHRIYCGTSAQNGAMQKLALYLGMQQEGRRREALYKNNVYEDIIEYGLLSKEFFEKFASEYGDKNV